MTEEEIRKRAFAMPFTNPAFPPGPYRFVNREYLIITYRTDPERLRAIVPEPLALDGAVGEVRVHPHARFHRLRRLHRERPGDPGVAQRPARELHALHVPRRRVGDRGRARALGLSQEAREPEPQDREGHAGRHPRLRSGARGHRHDGLQAPHAGRFADQASQWVRRIS